MKPLQLSDARQSLLLAMVDNLAATLKPFELAARQLQGWDLQFRPEEIRGEMPWDYETLAATMINNSTSVLDLGTGGGEVYSRLIASSTCDTYATEAWERNAPIARKRLAGIAPVTRCLSEQLPFADHAFDLVLSRHEAICPAEIARVLEKHGRFLSQQVIHDFMFELRDYFPDTVIFPDFYQSYQDDFRRLGMQVSRVEEFRYKIRFKEPGHLVYQLAAAPWMLPNFTVESHLDGLTALIADARHGKPMTFTAGFYLFEVTGVS